MQKCIYNKFVKNKSYKYKILYYQAFKITPGRDTFKEGTVLKSIVPTSLKVVLSFHFLFKLWWVQVDISLCHTVMNNPL